MNSTKDQNLGFFSMVLLGINGIIGSGIFLLPGKVMALSGNWSAIVYLIVTMIVLSIAWCFAQCASLFDRNGGAYLYAKEAFGDFVGFEIGMMRWVVGTIAWASIVVGFMTALGSLWPSLTEEPIRSSLIFLLIASLSVLNIFDIKLFKLFNNWITVAKLIPLIFFVCLGVFFVESSHYQPLRWEEFEWNSFGSSALIIFYAFGGFETLVVAAGEMKNPKKNLPLAVMVAISFTSILYFLIQWIAIGVLGEALSSSTAPLSDAAHLLIGEGGRWLVSISMLISIGGINLAASFITPRSGVALAEDGLLPRWIAQRSSYGTPTGAILITAFFTFIFALSGTFSQLIIMSVIARFAQYLTTSLAIYVLHKRMNFKRGFFQRALYKIVPLIALAGVCWLLSHASFVQILLGLGGLILAIPLYWLQKNRLYPNDSAIES